MPRSGPHGWTVGCVPVELVGQADPFRKTVWASSAPQPTAEDFLCARHREEEIIRHAGQAGAPWRRRARRRTRTDAHESTHASRRTRVDAHEPTSEHNTCRPTRPCRIETRRPAVPVRPEGERAWPPPTSEPSAVAGHGTPTPAPAPAHRSRRGPGYVRHRWPHRELPDRCLRHLRRQHRPRVGRSPHAVDRSAHAWSSARVNASGD